MRARTHTHTLSESLSFSHTVKRTHARAHTHTHTCTCTRARTHTRALSLSHARARAHTHTRARTHTHARTRARARARTHTHTHARTHARAHTHTHTHTPKHLHTYKEREGESVRASAHVRTVLCAPVCVRARAVCVRERECVRTHAQSCAQVAHTLVGPRLTPLSLGRRQHVWACARSGTTTMPSCVPTRRRNAPGRDIMTPHGCAHMRAHTDGAAGAARRAGGPRRQPTHVPARTA